MKTIKISNHQVSGANEYFFDTNVWLYLYAPIVKVSQGKQQQYAKLFRDIIDRKACLYITFSIISEYINSVLRMEFKHWKDANQGKSVAGLDFKRHYRPTKDYEDTLKDAIEQVKIIISKTNRRPDDFNSVNLNDILDKMGKDADFNDVYMIKSCESKGIILVSDDKDIQNIDSEICLITA